MAECEKCRHSEARVAALDTQVAKLREAIESALKFIYDCETGVNGVEQMANATIDKLEAALAAEPPATPGGTNA